MPLSALSACTTRMLMTDFTLQDQTALMIRGGGKVSTLTTSSARLQGNRKITAATGISQLLVSSVVCVTVSISAAGFKYNRNKLGWEDS